MMNPFAWLPGVLRDDVESRRVKKPRRTYGTIIVEGPIGAGKSTLCKELGSRSRVILFDELTKSMTSIVERFYSGKLSPISAQIKILELRRKMYSKYGPDKSGTYWKVFDRSMWGDFVLAAANLHGCLIDMMNYEEKFLSSEGILNATMPTLQVYIHADLDTCIERIKMRRRECELSTLLSEDGLGYLSKIISLGKMWHLDMLSVHIPTLCYDAHTLYHPKIENVVDEILYVAGCVPVIDKDLKRGLNPSLRFWGGVHE
jgi:deoxyadenosine/deoxycytidine kinase